MIYRKDDDEKLLHEDGAYPYYKKWTAEDCVGDGMEAMEPLEVMFEQCEKKRKEENPPYFFHHDEEDEEEN